MFTRRHFLFATTAILANMGLGCAPQGDPSSRRVPVFIASSADADNQHYLTLMDANGAIKMRFPIEGRGHGVAVRNNGDVAMFARRPGDFVYIVAAEQQEQPGIKLTSIEGRHFYGHGCFSQDGRYLFATENDYENQRGVIGVYDALDRYKRLDEFNSYGVGPHEIVRSNDGRHLIVANGGIATHPAQPREKLNIDTMASSLTYIDAETGALDRQYFLEDERMSLRHLSCDAEGLVVVVFQYQGEAHHSRPLIGFQQGQGGIRLAQAESAVWHSLNQYTASVASDPKRGVACVTSPRGHRVSFWNTRTGDYIDSHRLRDAGGVVWSAKDEAFAVSNGQGQVRFYGAFDSQEIREKRLSLSNLRWDNHMRMSW